MKIEPHELEKAEKDVIASRAKQSRAL